MAAQSVSVVIPVYNSAGMLARCLRALRESVEQPDEILVADDASTDNSAAIAEDAGARLVALKVRSGPAAARNAAAAVSNGDILFFLDADVCVHPDAIARVKSRFQKESDLDALIGSYDDNPGERNFLSQYRNLMHAYYHRSGNPEATTFWTGCGAVRASAFHAVGGFDAKRYAESSIEDIELGYRLHAAGYRLLLDPAIQGQHQKRWTFENMLRTDLFARAIPWTRLILASKRMPDDLNVRNSQRVSVALVFLATFLLPIVPVASLIALCILTGLNWRFYSFLGDRRGWWFTVRAVPLHWLYFLYSGVGFFIGALLTMAGK